MRSGCFVVLPAAGGEYVFEDPIEVTMQEVGRLRGSLLRGGSEWLGSKISSQPQGAAEISDRIEKDRDLRRSNSGLAMGQSKKLSRLWDGRVKGLKQRRSTSLSTSGNPCDL
jgi:hypothetical protein